MVDLGALDFSKDQSLVTRHAMGEDSLVKYLKFERVTVGLSFDISFLHFDVL